LPEETVLGGSVRSGRKRASRVGLPEMSSLMLGETDLKPSGAGRCGDADPVAGDTGPDRRVGVGETVTDLPHLGEEDHVPSSPLP
jgi:hypothetical protein